MPETKKINDWNIAGYKAVDSADVSASGRFRNNVHPVTGKPLGISGVALAFAETFAETNGCMMKAGLPAIIGCEGS